jgi:NADPH2:quinone reductase
MTDAYAFTLTRTGGPEVLEAQNIAIPSPGPGEVLVRHEAVGLNFIETYHRSGLYPVPLPSGLGTEAAGVVEAVGEGVSGFREGNRVGYFTGPLGSYATHRVITEERLVKLPDSISTEQAAAAMLKGCTAEYLVERCASVQPGDVVLVHAAAGGVGSILVPWLKHLGAVVIAHSGDSRKAALAKDSGADHSLCGAFEDLAADVRALTGGKGVKVVLDGVGAASWAASLGSVAARLDRDLWQCLGAGAPLYRARPAERRIGVRDPADAGRLRENRGRNASLGGAVVRAHRAGDRTGDDRGALCPARRG